MVHVRARLGDSHAYHHSGAFCTIDQEHKSEPHFHMTLEFTKRKEATLERQKCVLFALSSGVGNNEALFGAYLPRSVCSSLF